MRKEDDVNSSDSKSTSCGDTCKEKDKVSIKKQFFKEMDETKLTSSSPKTAITNVSPQRLVSINEIAKNVGKISARELQDAFKSYQGKHYSDNVCKFVVRLFDLDKNGGLDIREFEQLYFCVKEWVSAFNACDKNRSGYLTETELDLALKHMDVNCNPEFVAFLINKSDPLNKKMSLDQFIINCVQMQKFSDEFRARDDKADGIIKLRYEDFLELLMKSL